MIINKITSIFLLGTIFLSSSCTTEPKFSFFCQKDKIGDYTIKWEVVSHEPEQKISIYMSDNDSLFEEPPVQIKAIDDYVTLIRTKNTLNRKFFRLKVDRTFSGIISNRHFEMDSLQNLRDMGGYYTRGGDQLKWGMLYRSGELNDISQQDIEVLDALCINTIIDLRNIEERSPDSGYKAKKVINLPVVTNSRAYVTEKILDGSFLPHDAIAFTQETYKSLIDDNTKEFGKLFDLLCDEKNYPVLLEAYLGKDRIGVASYLILKALGVSEDVIDEDYLASNNYISEDYVIGEARFLPETMQEAATVVCKTDIAYLQYAKSCMESKSGSVDQYIEDELGVTPEKKEKLKQILLYN